jgi:hypothetical protein
MRQVETAGRMAADAGFAGRPLFSGKDKLSDQYQSDK